MDISWTKFDTYQTCKLKYVLKYERKIKMPAPILFFACGAVTHQLIEGWSNNGFNNDYIKKHIVPTLNDYLGDTKFAKVSDYNDLLKKTFRATWITALTFNVLDIPKHNYSIEPRFRLPLFSGDVLVGGWDVLDKDTKSIYDIKTYSNPYPLKMGQLETYVLAALLQGIDVNRVGVITPLLNDKVTTKPVTGASVKERGKLLVETCSAIKKGVAPVPTTGSHCYGCEFNRTEHCPKTYQKVLKDVMLTKGRNKVSL